MKSHDSDNFVDSLFRLQANQITDTILTLYIYFLILAVLTAGLSFQKEKKNLAVLTKD